MARFLVPPVVPVSPFGDDELRHFTKLFVNTNSANLQAEINQFLEDLPVISGDAFPYISNIQFEAVFGRTSWSPPPGPLPSPPDPPWPPPPPGGGGGAQTIYYTALIHYAWVGTP